MQTHGDKGGSFDLLQDEIKEEDEQSQESGALENKSNNKADAEFELESLKRVNTDHNLYFGKYHKLIDDKSLMSPTSVRPSSLFKKNSNRKTSSTKKKQDITKSDKKNLIR